MTSQDPAPADRVPVRRGLTPEAVDRSRQTHGSNRLTPPARDPLWKQYLAKYDDPVIRILLIAAGISIAIGIVEGHYAEGLGIVIAVFLATGLAFWNELQAHRQFDILNRTDDDVRVKVIRSRGITEIPKHEVVVDDLVRVEVGEEIPADGELFDAVSLQVNEARLTGESVPVTKVPGSEPTNDPYPPNRLFRGTTVVDGYGTMRVTAVGDGTEIGRTARASAEESGIQTPLNRQLEALSKVIGVVGLGIASLTFWLLLARNVMTGELALTTGEWLVAGSVMLAALIGLSRVWLPIFYDGLAYVAPRFPKMGWLEREGARPWLEAAILGVIIGFVPIIAGIAAGVVPGSPGEWLPRSAVEELLQLFMIAVTIIVVAVPEGLAMSVTLSLAYSMRKMAAMNNLVRRMHACETIGAATVICSDKTGTLTRNEMRVVAAEFAWLNGEPPTRRTAALLMESMAANSTANLSRETGADPVPIGNPTEGALLLWMHEHGVDYATERSNFTIDVQWTFTTERKFMGTLGQSAVLGRTVVFVKGAPEIVLERCSQRHAAGGAMTLSDADRQEIRDHVASYQVRAMRVLALAYSVDPASHDLETVGRDMIWFGFVAISDPVREEVPGAVAQCQAAGVRVKIVTGDNPVTTREIARQIGLTKDSAARHFALTGPEFGAMDDAAASEAAEELTILARARPIDKMRLVQLLQKRGHVVAVTGDGVNDGPALNYADVGLSMGKTGSAVAKEASDIVLLDDSFRSIVTAVMWGRSLYENIQRFLLFQLTINVAALGLALLGPLVGVKLPLTVMQMLWINLIMDTFAALALATQPANPRVLERKPRHVSDFIVTKTMAFGIFGMGALVLVIMLGLMAWLSREGIAIDSEAPSRGGTIVFTVFVLLQFWNLFNARAMGSDRPGFIGLTANPWFLLIVVAIALGQMLIVQFGGTFFRTVPLTAVDWLLAFAATSGILVIGEGVRFLRHVIGKQATRS